MEGDKNGLTVHFLNEPKDHRKLNETPKSCNARWKICYVISRCFEGGKMFLQSFSPTFAYYYAFPRKQ